MGVRGDRVVLLVVRHAVVGDLLRAAVREGGHLGPALGRGGTPALARKPRTVRSVSVESS